MENKVIFKRYSIVFLIVILIFSTILTYVNIKEYQFYRKNVNYKLASIITLVKEKYPEVDESEIMNILRSSKKDLNALSKYGYDIESDAYLDAMENSSKAFISLELAILLSSALALIVIVLLYKSRRDKELKNIINLIEKINHKNYELEFKDFTEDELSILKSEIYKTTLMLKESAENSQIDKVNLKNSLSDISHQLKTPLTSILIMLDNIIDDEDMDSKTRQDFIKDIKREIIKINFLVQSILKLSKFESNTIEFIIEEVTLKEIIDNSIKNVSSLCDLKNIEVLVEGNTNIKIKCDKTWQIEALTNILKNSVEHSSINSKIKVSINKTNVYQEITITDYGSGMDEEDIEHIFERFYKSKSSKKDSIGIGLELSKRIIEASNGRITVKSTPNLGTTFTIKYFN